jgi:GAF domain-containing protein
MALLPEDMSVDLKIVIDELETAIAEMESHLESVRAERDEAKAHGVELGIENANLRRELALANAREGEALEQQKASSDILDAISNSVADAQPVFDAICASLQRLMPGADLAISARGDDGRLHWRAGFGELVESIRASFPRPAPAPQGLVTGTPSNWPDVLHGPGAPESLRASFRAIGRNASMLSVAMVSEGLVLGTLAAIRLDMRPFTNKEARLLKAFADQAAIAIRNAGLFNETKQALAKQTATSDILRVISQSPTDVQPVFNAIVTAAVRLLRCDMAFVVRCDAITYSPVAGATSDGVFALRTATTVPIDPDANFPSRAIISKQIVHLPDWSGLELPEHERSIQIANGVNSSLYLPLLRERECIGLLIFAGKQANSFGDSGIALAESFRDQAIIAIENVRLFDELQQRTDDLGESLQQQTATADVLKLISRSAFDLQAVLDTLTESAARLCNADMASISRQHGTEFQHVTNYNFAPDWVDYTRSFRMPAGRGSVVGRALLDGRVVQVADVLADPEYTYLEPQKKAGYRTFLSVPLLREGRPIGVLSVCNRTVRPFSDKQIQLVSTFADQAVIAIENVRLFDEVQAKTRDLSEALTYQTGSANILKVIASSPTEVGPVLKAIVDNACELCDAYDAAVLLKDGGDLRFDAHHGPIPIGLEKWPINRRWTAGRAFLDKKPVHIHDLLADESADFSDGREMSLRMGHRSILSVPLLRDGESIGAIVLRRTEVNPFTNKQIALLQTFADQAVIAIGNVHLFEEVQQRTLELARSLDDLRTAQDRLVQTEKLASLGQLTAGIAHEIKNPLNFVNNFASLSAELTGELNDVLKQADIGEKIRAEVDELTGLLKNNLEKIVQHGKRADSIVKNMLLHSREGSGEHRLSNINALIDESLNLAYHGARAEKPDFNVTLTRDFDPAAGMVEVFPQEVTRVFLNLVSNGFYAVANRSQEDGYDPVLSATTRNLGESVEIRIRDNGAGIRPEVREKMFNPFFTTKPAGEGTGLGLSMSHDIIVKQHNGTIDVDTEPGQFTEFRIVLPRSSNLSNKKRV